MSSARGSRKKRLAFFGSALLAAAIAIALLFVLRGDTVDAGAKAPQAGADRPACSVTVAGLEAVQPALATAQPGSTICLRDGT